MKKNTPVIKHKGEQKHIKVTSAHTSKRGKAYKRSHWKMG